MSSINEFKMENNSELLLKFGSLIKESDINFQIPDELMLCFIYARKREVQRAMKLLKNYLRVMKNYPELFTDLRGERVKHVLDLGHLLASPIRDQNGSRVFIINARNWDIRRCSLEDVYSAVVFCFQRMVSEMETQSKGVVGIMDFQDFALHQIRHFTPSFVKKVADLIQDVFPIRLKGIHIVNEPRIIKILVAMIWPFLSNKIRNRLFFHGSCFTTLHHHVDPSCLPSNYDGCLGPMSSMHFSSVFFEEDYYSNIFECFN
ncbi:alpha-tocopherol transfer protein-like [Daphnia pulicaria]|uniref:alpha-tocopherol transfer protein-like n=1 Tax=Daphnia pulicaria TaxID=35523 RepID=UPI001EEC9454|nr:alpha-tocopherol transfer protein-like [Daphnia pulicaria]XP_046644518.1 alpha-tocopherol transfer protein-like [Daphnia pulicaria]XP_046644520.1 alpha-tocopherol transfer protein-like [Daphnia pulicaria]XP_046644521.1 alpha-tocopherol transfer protein-like [Daphnia pulicaria]